MMWTIKLINYKSQILKTVDNITKEVKIKCYDKRIYFRKNIYDTY